MIQSFQQSLLRYYQQLLAGSYEHHNQNESDSEKSTKRKRGEKNKKTTWSREGIEAERYSQQNEMGDRQDSVEVNHNVTFLIFFYFKK
jgi:hypothetical protein